MGAENGLQNLSLKKKKIRDAKDLIEHLTQLFLVDETLKLFLKREVQEVFKDDIVHQ